MTLAPQSATQDEFGRAEAAAQFVGSQTALRPQLAVVLGSGLGAFGDRLSERVSIPYESIPGFPLSSAEGHAGRLLAGKIAGAPLFVMQGRVHLYEGHSPKDVIFPMRVFGRLGVRAVVLTNAAGVINLEWKPGTLVLLRDHINLQGVNPLTGPNDPRFGPRFFDMTRAYDVRLQEIALEEGKRLGLVPRRGVYAALSGPTYETPAEIRHLKTIGADLVGMSTVPEVIAARHMGIRVLAISCVTNYAAGLSSQPINHQEVLAIGERVQAQLTALLSAIIPRLQAEVASPPQGS